MSASVHPWLQAFAYAEWERCHSLSQPPPVPLLASASHSDVSAHTAFRPGKKAQIVKFLTFRPESDPLAALDIWAQVSDPEHFVACRFLAEAVTHFRQAVAPFVDLTSLKGAILLLKQARVAVWNDPIPAQIRNSPWASVRGPVLILEVAEWKVLGCIGEPTFWEGAQEICAPYRRRLVTVQRPVRSEEARREDDDLEAFALRGQCLRQWVTG
ncbi:hypothetical protein OC846_001987 [Tilletia horrida]|uniref:Shelterin complex subunit TPP1/Est3 domain-containing protein n=1 Tax=Tilletia horrida TaxID=155126 RepID=A0AAN6GSX9_9BASI|nr:hypothetical protein OC846_001987 [Tilletia horrida]